MADTIPLFPDESAPELETISLFPEEEEREDEAISLFPEQDLQKTVKDGAEINPGTAARVLKLQESTGLPGGLVERNLDEVEAKAAERNFDSEKFRTESPRVAEWLAEDKNRVAVAQGDTTLQERENFFNAFNVGARETLNLFHMVDLLAKERREGLTGYETEMLALYREKAAAFQEAGDALTFAPHQFGYVSTMLGDLAQEAGTGAAKMGLGMAGAGFLVGGPPGAAAFGTAGVPAGAAMSALRYMYELEGTLAWDEFRDLEDEFGNKLDPELVNTAADIVGGINAFIELGSDVAIYAMWKAMGGAGTVQVAAAKAGLKRFVKDAVPKVLVKPSILGTTVKAGGVALATSAIEGLEEVWQNFTKAFVEAGMKEVSGQLFKDMDWAQVATESAEQFWAAFVGTLPLPFLGGAIPYSRQIRQIRNAQENQTAMEFLGENISESEMHKKLPEATASLVQTLKQGGVIDNVYVNVDAWDAAFQEDAAKAAGEVFGSAEQYIEARALNADLVIPIETYAEKLAATEFHGELLEDIRLHETDISSRDAKELQSQLDDMMAEEQAEQARTEDPVRQVYNHIFDQLTPIMGREEAKRNATMEAAKIRAAAIQLNVDPWELYSEQPLTVRRDLLGDQSKSGLLFSTIEEDRKRFEKRREGIEAEKAEKIMDLFRGIGTDEGPAGGGKWTAEKGFYTEKNALRILERWKRQTMIDEGEEINEVEIEEYLTDLDPNDIENALEDVTPENAFDYGGDQPTRQYTKILEMFESLGGEPEGGFKWRAESGFYTEENGLRILERLYRRGMTEQGERFTERDVEGYLDYYRRNPGDMDHALSEVTPENVFELAGPPVATAVNEPVGWRSDLHKAQEYAIRLNIAQDIAIQEWASLERLVGVIESKLSERGLPEGDPWLWAQAIGQTAESSAELFSKLETLVGTNPEFAATVARTLMTASDEKILASQGAWEPEEVRRIAGIINARINAGRPLYQRAIPQVESIIGTLPAAAAEGLAQNASQEVVFNVEDAARGIASGDTPSGVLFQGVTQPTPAGKFMRGTQKTAPPAQDVVRTSLERSKLKVRPEDGGKSVAGAYQRGKRNKYLSPIVVGLRKKLRWKKTAKPFYGNQKMRFPSEAYPKGRSTWDIPGCGRVAWAMENKQDLKDACYGGKCYAEALIKAHMGEAAGATTGLVKRPANQTERAEITKHFEESGLGETIEKYGNIFEIKINQLRGSKNYGKLSIGKYFDAEGNLVTPNLAGSVYSAAVISTNLDDATGQDMRIGVDTDGAAWLADESVLDALLKANPRSLSVFSSAYHSPPVPHKLSGRTIINVTISGWHPLSETFSRLRWAEEARANGWNVILREVVVNPEATLKSGEKQFSAEEAENYNRVHEALLETDFFVMLQSLHSDRTRSGDPASLQHDWGIPACCKGSDRNPGTCDACEVTEGLGKQFLDYWNIEETDSKEEQILPDLIKEAEERGIPAINLAQEGARAMFDPGTMTITMLAQADPSSFQHEGAHAYLENLRRWVQRADAPQQMKDDWQTISEWTGGIPSDVSEAIPIEAHEKWARGWESYLMEGKSPSVALRDAFMRLMDWLVRIYKSAIALNVELNPEIREVMDRTIATQDEIAEARLDAGVDEEILPPDWMTAEETRAYNKLRSQAREEAETDVRTQLMNEMTREQKQFWKTEQKLVEAEVTAEVDEQPVYVALAAMGTEVEKLSKDAIVAQYGADFLKTLPRPYVYQVEGGLHPDEAAEIFGFSTGAELLNALANAPKKNAVIDMETQARMLERHGDLMNDGTLPERAAEAVANDKQMAVYYREMQVLLRHGAIGPLRPMATVKEIARTVIAGKEIGAINPKYYENAAAKAGRDAIRAMLGKDPNFVRKIGSAFEARQRQVLNLALFKEATAQKKVFTKSMEDWKVLKRADKRLAKTRNMDMVNAARAVLANYGVGKKGKSAADYMQPMEDYDPATYYDLMPLVTLVTSQKKPLKKLTTGEFMMVKDAIDGLMNMSRTANKMLIEGKRVKIDTAKGELIPVIEERGQPYAKLGYNRSISSAEKRWIRLLGWKAATRRVEHWVEAMDGGEFQGVFRKYIWQPISDAIATYRVKKRDVMNEWLEGMKKLEKTLTIDKIDAPELDYVFGSGRRRAYEIVMRIGATGSGRAELLGALLHVGNESNFEKLLVGRGWAEIDEETGAVDTSKWDAFITRMQDEGVLTKEDYDFIQFTWNLMETLKPDAQRANKEVYGFYFPEITAKPFNTKWGEYAGGYFPATPDRMMVDDAARWADQEALEGQQGAAMLPSQITTGRGFTVARAPGYRKPLALDIRQTMRHIDQVLRFTYINPRVREVGRLVNDKEFRASLKAFDPKILESMIIPWLQRAASQQIFTPSATSAGRQTDDVLNALRSGSGLQIMALNASVATQQFAGPWIATSKVPVQYLADASLAYLRAPHETTEMIAEKSVWMSTAFGESVFEIQRRVEDIIINPSTYDTVADWTKDHGYILASLAQGTVNKFVWLGSYNHSITEGLDEKVAVKKADSVVRTTQGTFNPEDLSAFETGSPLVRGLTMFFNYFSTIGNLYRTHVPLAIHMAGFTGAPRLLYLYLFAFMIPAAMAKAITMAWSGELFDDEDDWLDKLFEIVGMAQIETVAAMIPGGMVAMSGINRFNDKFYDDRIAVSPVVSTLETMVSVPIDITRMATGEDVSGKKVTKDVLTTIGILTNTPVGAAARPIGYALSVEEGKTDPENVVDYARGLISGRGPQ